MEKSKEKLEKCWHNEPKNWKLGVFYFNKNDKRVFVDKPNPNYGITLNFANPKAYLTVIISFLFFGFILYLITKNK